jgi:Na+/H+-dicarboxylate symporter
MDQLGDPHANVPLRYAAIAVLFVIFDAESVLLFAVASRIHGSVGGALSVLAFAAFLGLGLVNVFQPGVGVQVQASQSIAEIASRKPLSGWELLTHLFPTSVVQAMAEGEILQLVVFSIFFGIAVAAIGKRGQPIIDVLESTAQAMFKFTGYVMLFAPVGVMAAIAATVGKMGLGILLTLSELVLLMYGGLLVFALIVLGGVSLIIRVPFFTFLKAVREPFLIAFTTASRPGLSNRTSTTYRSAGASTTLGTSSSRSKRLTSDATTLIGALPNDRLYVRELETLVTKKRATSPFLTRSE